MLQNLQKRDFKGVVGCIRSFPSSPLTNISKMILERVKSFIYGIYSDNRKVIFNRKDDFFYVFIRKAT